MMHILQMWEFWKATQKGWRVVKYCICGNCVFHYHLTAPSLQEAFCHSVWVWMRSCWKSSREPFLTCTDMSGSSVQLSAIINVNGLLGYSGYPCDKITVDNAILDGLSKCLKQVSQSLPRTWNQSISEGIPF